MEITLDLIITAAMNIVVLIAGFCYIRWTNAKKNEVVDSGPAPSLEPAADLASSKAQTTAQPQAVQSHSQTTSTAKATAREAAVLTKVSPSPQTDGKDYVGTVKRFSDRHGWGLISSSSSFTLYGSDVRIFKDEYERSGVYVGDTVEFQVVVGQRSVDKKRAHPWATRVRRLGRSDADVLGGGASNSVGSGQSTFNAGAAEFVPAPRSLSVAAAEFVPGGDPYTASGNSGLNVAAAEFVPGNGLSSSVHLSSDAAAFIPGAQQADHSRRNWDAY